MLTEIYIKNYLMLSEIRLALGKGLTVLSGETGAGKSILVGSISLIFGDNSPGVEAFDKTLPIYLEATFQVNSDPTLQDFLAESGIEGEIELIIAREINTQGKSGYFLNGRKTTAAVVKELKPLMLDFHHQRDQQRLLSSVYQLELLDSYANAEPLREEFGQLYHKTKQNLKQLDTLAGEAANQKQIQDLYRFQYEELDGAKLTDGEDLALQQEYDLLSHAKEINEISTGITNNLFECENSIYDQLGISHAQLKRYESLNPRLQEASLKLILAMDGIRDTVDLLNSASESINADPDRLDFIQNRLDQINNLVYKHKVRSIAELKELFAQRAQQIARFANLEEEIEKLKQQLQQDFVQLKRIADELTKLRVSVAGLLCAELQESIHDLNIPEGIFEIRIDKKSKAEFNMPQFIASVSETGQDAAEFLFSANPGFELKPLAAVVSGGELSRILLAIKKVLASRIPEKLIILDEIDSGIGGKTAGLVAKFISCIAERQQVLCITHLAQIAAVAVCHIAIVKNSDRKHSEVSMHLLEGEARQQEIARMLSGFQSVSALEHAKELLRI